MAQGLAIFGGTFDPVHCGHLQAALEIQEQLALTEVRLIPAASPPQRPPPRAAAADRRRMLELAVAGEPGLKVDPCELDRHARDGKPSFTADTLIQLRSEVGPKVPILLALGTDAFARLPAWHSWKQLFDLVHLLVLLRPGGTLSLSHCPEALQREVKDRRASLSRLQKTPYGRLGCLAVTQLDISSTAVRKRLALEQSVDYLVPEAVSRYLHKRQIYAPSRLSSATGHERCTCVQKP